MSESGKMRKPERDSYLSQRQFRSWNSGALTFLVSLAVLALGFGCKARESVTLQGSTMGTSYRIKLRNLPPEQDAAELKKAIDELLHETDYRFSSWQQDELYKVNNHPVGSELQISPDFCLVLYKSQLVWKSSEGEFDPTIGDLINLWGFGPEENQGKPGDAQIKAALAQAGFQNLKLSLPGGGPGSTGEYQKEIQSISDLYSLTSVNSLPNASQPEDSPSNQDAKAGCSLIRSTDLNLNLSAIAKGHGVDRVAQLLRKKGLQDFMVEIGGEIKTGPGGAFRIGIERPNYDGTRSLYTVLESRNNCIATSGNYRNFFEKDGKIYSHILDPNTGRPGLSRIQSATVVGPDCALADALATAAMILDPESSARMLNAIHESTGEKYEFLILESGELIQGDTENFKIEEYTSSGLSDIRIQK